MKFLAWIVGILAVIVVGIYTLLFTSFGNKLLKPVIESEIQRQTLLASKLEVFNLSMSDFEIILDLNANNIIIVKGNYSLFSQSFNIAYRVKLDELHTLQTLTSAHLQGAFFTEGKVVGDMKFLEVDGTSDLAKSETLYHVEVKDFTPTSIIAKVEGASLSSLLYMASQKQYASADIDLEINFKSIKQHALDGDVKLLSKNGKIDTHVMKQDFNITLPKTLFNINFDAQLKGDDVAYTSKLVSNLVKVSSTGTLTPTPLKMDMSYKVNMKELALLKPMIGADIRGRFSMSGDVKGSKEKLRVSGVSDVGASDTSFTLTLKEFIPKSLHAKVKDLHLQKVLYMLKQPHYSDGLFSMQADINDLSTASLDGVVKTTIREGVLDNVYLSKAYEFESLMPKTKYKLESVSTLDGSEVKTKLTLDSTLAKLDIKEAVFDIGDASLRSDYKVNVASLNKLFFITQRKLRGGIEVEGEVKKAKDLDVTIFSHIAGGKIDAKLHNDDFVANMKSLQTLDILHILIYPEIFRSKLDGTLTYNLADAKGDVKAKLFDGSFQKNEMLHLVKKYTKVDLYVEKFSGDLHAKINKEKIVASLDLKSNKSAIKSTNTKLNTLTKKIDSKLTIVANTYPLTIGLKGAVSSPKISVDAKELIKSKTGKAIEKELGKLFKGLF